MTPPTHDRSAATRLRAAFAIALALALAGCSSLPTITPDLARASAGDVRLQAANGRILSPQRTEAILARLGGDSADTLARHLALEQEVSGAPLSTGNSVELLQDGPDTYANMLTAIAGARDHIHIETYILDDDEVGRRFADALIAKQQEGVAVHLIHDGVGTLDTPRSYFDRLREAGIRTIEFNPVNPLRAKAGWDVNERDHRKMLIVDGQAAVIGGINISSVYSSAAGSASKLSGGGGLKNDGGKPRLPWRDTDLRIDGPVVAELQKLFMETWQKQNGPPLPERNYFPPQQPVGRAVVRAIGSSPDDPYSQIYVTLISAINSAEKAIWLTNAYFVPDPQLLEALIAAARRGVDVRLILPSVSDSSLVFHAGRSHYQALLDGGVKLHERQGALLHAKTGVIDGGWSTVGSTNLDWRSFLHNQELSAVVLGPIFGGKMRAAFERDLAASTEITAEAWAERGVGARAKEWFSRMWEYWL